MAAAYTATKKGQPVVVIEGDSQVGDLAKSIEYLSLDFLKSWGSG